MTCGLFTADGKNICTGIATPVLIRYYSGESAGLTPLSACWGGSVVAGSTDGTVRVWGPKTGLCKHVFNGHGFHDGPITAIASHHEGALLLSGALAWSVLRL